MKKEEIKFGDWMRMWVGEAPPEFFIEAIIRIAFIYVLLMVSMRLMGKRMAAQLSRNELLALVTLAAAIGVPMQAPDRGLVPALIIAIVVVLIGRLTAYLAFKNQRFEKITQGNVTALVEDSVMQLKPMLKSRITVDRVCAQLRSMSVYHLGEVKRLYIEANGSFTLVRNNEQRPGLSIIPEWDIEMTGTRKKAAGISVCKKCGKLNEGNLQSDKCPNCGDRHWTDAVI
jgi:uncharacterized membrane protein YcaP (DUF421 family)